MAKMLKAIHAQESKKAALVVWDFYHIRKNVCLWLDIWVTQIVEADAWETTGLSPAGVEYRKVYNRLKAKKQRGKISRDEWNATVSQAQKVLDMAENYQMRK